jgi:hypothetical protein
MAASSARRCKAEFCRSLSAHFEFTHQPLDLFTASSFPLRNLLTRCSSPFFLVPHSFQNYYYSYRIIQERREFPSGHHWAVARPIPVVPPVIRMVLLLIRYRSLVQHLCTTGLVVKSVLLSGCEATFPSRGQRHYCRGHPLCLVRSSTRPNLLGIGRIGMRPQLLQLPQTRQPHLAQVNALPAFQNPARSRPDP